MTLSQKIIIIFICLKGTVIFFSSNIIKICGCCKTICFKSSKIKIRFSQKQVKLKRSLDFSFKKFLNILLCPMNIKKMYESVPFCNILLCMEIK